MTPAKPESVFGSTVVNQPNITVTPGMCITASQKPFLNSIMSQRSSLPGNPQIFHNVLTLFQTSDTSTFDQLRLDSSNHLTRPGDQANTSNLSTDNLCSSSSEVSINSAPA